MCWHVLTHASAGIDADNFPRGGGGLNSTCSPKIITNGSLISTFLPQIMKNWGLKSQTFPNSRKGKIGRGSKFDNFEKKKKKKRGVNSAAGCKGGYISLYFKLELVSFRIWHIFRACVCVGCTVIFCQLLPVDPWNSVFCFKRIQGFQNIYLTKKIHAFLMITPRFFI